MWVCTYVCVYVCMYVLYVCTYVCMYVRMYVYMYVCMYVYMYVLMYVCTYVCMSNIIITNLDMVSNVQDTDIWCSVLLLQSRVRQSQHWTSQYFHFSRKHLLASHCMQWKPIPCQKGRESDQLRNAFNSCVRGTEHKGKGKPSTSWRPTVNRQFPWRRHSCCC